MHISDCPRARHRRRNRDATTKCARMTEEAHRLHGMNGNAVAAAADGAGREECHKANSYGQGGRLKFFKDGKFILELERAREGERVSWVSVHRKTFWPPQGTAASVPAYRQESSTSLSVSDDNSSIQSSPWQRDHSWKQTSPKRDVSRSLTFYFHKSKELRRLCRRSKKRRAPYSTCPDECHIVRIKRENGAPETVVKNEIDLDLEYVKVKREDEAPGRVRKKGGRLLVVVQRLLDKGLRTSTPPRAESVVSPRKRFLREMERDKPQPEDANCHKKSRSKPQQAVVVQNVAVASNGVDEPTTKPAIRNSNYSITSLLSEDRRSPGQHGVAQQHAYGCSAGTDDRWYSESVDRLRSIELSHAEKCGYPAPYHHHHHAPPYLGPYTAYSYPGVPPYYGGYMLPSSAFHGGGSPLPMAPSLREGPSCSWGDQPRQTTTEGDRRDDAITDMPLNLSKHSG